MSIPDTKNYLIQLPITSQWCHDPSFVEVNINFLQAYNEGEEDRSITQRRMQNVNDIFNKRRIMAPPVSKGELD